MNSSLTLLLVATYFCVLLYGLTRRGQVLQHRWLFLLRSFFPNWQFYAHVGVSPRLWIRLLDSTHPGADERSTAAVTDHNRSPVPRSDWALVYPRAKRRWAHLVHNPAIALALYEQNLLDHLIADMADNDAPEAVAHHTSYQLLQRVAESHLAALMNPADPHGVAPATAARFWQFCVTQSPTGQPISVERDAVLISQPLPLPRIGHE
jgi:hypothetical protein